MEKTRIVIVDDSALSVSVIKDVLEKNNYEVVGMASSLESLKQTVRDTKPDLVTMDLTLPFTDGFECTRAVYEIDDKIKVVFVSSMLDDDIMDRAKELKVAAYVQKPFTPEELLLAIHRAIATSDDPYHFLQVESLDVFKQSLKYGLKIVTHSEGTYKERYVSGEVLNEMEGVSIITGIVGLCSGRALLAMSSDTAKALSSAALRKEEPEREEVVNVISEFKNIVVGNTCSTLNKMNKDLNLRITPPIVFWGDGKSFLAPPSFITYTSIVGTDYGDLVIDIGFKANF